MYSGYSSVVSAKPVLAVSASVKGARASRSSIKFSWTKGTEASGNEVYRATTKSGIYSKTATITSRLRVSFTNKVTKGKTYYYKSKVISCG